MNRPLDGVRRLVLAGLISVAVVGCASTAVPAAATASPSPAAATATPTATDQPTQTPSPSPSPSPTVAPTASGPAMSGMVGEFVKRVSSPTFQFQGRLFGRMTYDIAGSSMSGTIAGTMKAKGSDSALAMTISILGQKQTTETIVVAPYTYARTGTGAWTKAQNSTASTNISDVFTATQGLEDAGVAAFDGRSLHKLVPPPGTHLDPAALGFGDGGAITMSSVELAFWAKADGTPAGMSMDLKGSQTINGVSADVTMSIGYTFDQLSGVTIVAPKV